MPAGEITPPGTSASGLVWPEVFDPARTIVLATAGPKLVWSWTGARALPPGDLGDPVSGTTGYQLCFYDGAATLLMSADVAAGGQCGGSACWKALASGNVRYKDATGASGGIVGMTLMPSALRPGRIRVRGPAGSVGGAGGAC